MKILKNVTKAELLRLIDRSADTAEVEAAVREIIRDVRKRGDAAVIDCTERFDGARPSSLLFTEREISSAFNFVSDKEQTALKAAIASVLDYQRGIYENAKLGEGIKDGVGIILRPVDSAGIYVPGGKASYPSSVYMCALPAIAAGVGKLVMTTPAAKGYNPLVLAAARECGIGTIAKAGGAQAVAALAYGTESIPRVDLICGPGNIYVTMAKKAVYGDCGIDMLAGPSEIVIVADESADAEFIAADLAAQAEHDERARAILLTTSRELAQAVVLALDEALQIPKRKIAEAALAESFILLDEDMDVLLEAANTLAPEHLELCVRDTAYALSKIRNAGAVFLGNYSPEALGDYYAGPDHVLPTGRSARFSSPLSAETFLRKISVITYDEARLKSAADNIITIANSEGLTAHANSISVRLKEKRG